MATTYQFTCKGCGDEFEVEGATNKRQYCDDCLAERTAERNRINQANWRQRHMKKASSK